MRYLWDAWPMPRHVTFRPQACYSAMRFQKPATTGGSFVESESRGCCGARWLPRFSGGQQPSIVQDTTAVPPPRPTNQRTLARLLHLTTSHQLLDYMQYSTLTPPTATTNKLITCRAPSEYLVNY